MSVRLYDIRFDRTRRLACKAKMNGSYPTITFNLFPAIEDKKPYVRTQIADTFGNLGDGTKDFSLEKTDFDALKQFLLDAQFPEFEATVIRNEKAVLRR